MLVGLLILASRGRTAELPPERAPPYSGVYRLSYRLRQDDGSQKLMSEETISIAVSGTRSRWDFAKEGRVAISDLAGPFTITFGGHWPPNVAIRMRTHLSQADWEFGYGIAAVACGGKPELLGRATIAGHACARLRCASDRYGSPEFCVAESGIVLRYANRSDATDATAWVYEAQSITRELPDADRFSPPPGYKIEDHEPRQIDW